MLKTGRKNKRKKSETLKDFYQEWIENLKSLLTLLQQSMANSANLIDSEEVPVTHHQFKAMVSSSELLSTHVQMLHRHFQAYFQALDLASRQDVSQLLYPSWRNSLEKPFLWLGDFHPFLFTHLLRSLLSNNPNPNPNPNPGKLLPFAFAWSNPSSALLNRIEQIDHGLRLMVPALVDRLRNAQERFYTCIASDWDNSSVREARWRVVDGAATTQIEELTGIFADVNRLRRSVLGEIIGVTDVYQAAVYLKGLSQFYIGFKDPQLVHDLERCKLYISPCT